MDEETVRTVAQAAEQALEFVQADMNDIVELSPCSNTVIKRRKKLKRQKMFAICKGNGKFKFINLDKLMDELENLGEKEIS